ncbi:Bug family tripartite tricarboxylate transporter substrate binding protein [Roseomonas haemaphysalidis]|uniref:Tripartite tricarboxylate transporter substrate binding protein n=1 Tax=Roseomonas haemaphysalidis TaxID=2768162 RepID=A0ABS3KRS0_9PROT|nr:tripartite tricarboxylate transporter substrate binding protein [Roseomonas haemaphysalidis]MBO1080142.1 tripartite tricarboxylate transporter substrate binding protein [Roseomonas haemaphysalidis]
MPSDNSRVPGFRVSRRSLLAATAVGALPIRAARAQDNWPSRTIRFVNPGPAGGAGDVLARLLGDRLGVRLGQTVVIEDRPGAGTNIGMTNVARSAPDGYTVGLGNIASNAVNKWLYKSLPFDPDKDFAPVSLMALVPNLMVVSPTLPATTVAEFIAYAKKNPGRINYGSVGAGSSQHLAGAQFGLTTGIEMQHIPYTSSGQLNTDMLEGRVQVLFQSVSAVSEMAKSGRMRPLAITGTERSPSFPEVPTLQQAGVDITSTGWFGMVTPAGVPEPILARLNKEVVACLEEPTLRARYIELGAIPRPSTREAFAAHMASETARWRDVVRATGASVD